MLIRKHYLLAFFVLVVLIACNEQEAATSGGPFSDSTIEIAKADTSGGWENPGDQRYGNPDSVVSFAESLIGVPYKYASTDPREGFDCSGFITYVYNHFNVTVPRSSVNFTNVGTTIALSEARRGDLILFTGTDTSIRIVGHMGIVTDHTDSLHFIHATSGKQYAVTVTPLNSYYLARFVKIIRL